METTISLLGHLSKIQQFSSEDLLMNYIQKITKYHEEKEALQIGSGSSKTTEKS